MNIFFCIKNYCSWSISSYPRVFSLQACPLEFKLFSPSTSACLQNCFSHVWFFVTLWTIAHKPPQSMESSRQEYWSEQPFPPPGDLPNPGIEPTSPALQAGSLPLSHQGNPRSLYEQQNSIFDMCHFSCIWIRVMSLSFSEIYLLIAHFLSLPRIIK